MTSLPPKARAVLTDCPNTGGGVHRWLFRAACVLHECGAARDAIAEEIRQGSAHCGRPVSLREIHNAINNSTGCTSAPSHIARDSTARPRKWPQRNAKAVAKACADGFGLADLWEISPLRFDDAEPHTEDIIDALFPNNPWLCVGASMSRFDTQRREDWRGLLHRAQLIVPSPMTDKTGITKNGRTSTHTLANTGPRRYLITEFDEGTFDEHAALLLELAQEAPFVLAVLSGGKSLHGWFLVPNDNEARQRVFMNCAVRLGADRATWTPSQFVRMPDGTRSNGHRQAVIYFNPTNLIQ
jgi:hypothetical protein